MDFPIDTSKPPYPLVVGQDTQDPPRGVDVIVNIKSPPCAFQKWGCIDYDWVEKSVCVDHDKDGNCTGRETREVKVCKEEGWVWTAAPDPIERIKIVAALSPDSIYDIEQGYIQHKYPHAEVKQGVYEIYEGFGGSTDRFLVDEFGQEGLHWVFRGSAEKADGRQLLIKDPGLYNITAWVDTTGIDPSYCSGKTQYCERCLEPKKWKWHCPETLHVYMVMGSLVSGE